ncbi:GDP-mannose 4,6-dehydratase [Burkholderia sp. AU19243]|uniref:GDP-mannose 4,6 dehydratase n=1 Tax=Burkholderia latens TaxID=488446 RepID=A0AAP1GA20_9BURK|nr:MULTISPECIES: NAD-dependent epimerase/dehydratase family protein [Burkholderia]AIO40601.1 3-beta hydroxysteroid dehydrogenase/isomerase family protein [Burkholderia cenocepacia]MBR7963256.1 GDP-mannose 4,6-dehydratase [Burkholderia vietnamiensis]KVA12955.1 GDP-mannose 4,6 dehydratase [Burkholderia latens]MBR8140821.1 GDP-mannose 4,6-dehydratase [Burkholderia vietnamiensis]MBR8361778.1 GDP-mannose 4,6-dehydratase [Burkholderia sp. AU19243]
MERHALITGASGFTAGYVADALVRAGHRVTGAGNHAHDGQIALDICSLEACRATIESVRPTSIVHLAAISFVGHDNASMFYDVNVIGTLNLLQACADVGHVPDKILIASSANIYGNASGAVSEAQPFAPVNHYAASKVAMEHLVRTWFDRLPIVITRPFNYTGRGQSPRFLVPKIVSHFAERKPRIELGNLDVSRDFSDVRYVADVYRALVENETAGEIVNICSGVAHSLTDIIDMCRDISGHDLSVEVNPAFVRANEVKMLTGVPDKLRAAVPDIAPIDLRSTLRWMLAAD